MRDVAQQDYFSALELADLAKARGITTFPTTKSGVIRYVQAKGWDASPLCRKRAGRGGGMEYHFNLLPDCLRSALDAGEVKTAVAARHQAETAVDQRRIGALKGSALSASARSVLEARAEILTAIDGYAIANGERRAWAIARFLDAISAWHNRQEIEARRDRGEALTPREAESLVRRLILTAPDGFQLTPETLCMANDRSGKSTISRRAIYYWFSARDEHGVLALAPAPTKEAQPIPPGFSDFLRHYAQPQKPSIPAAYKAYADECAAIRGAQPMTLTLDQVEYIIGQRLNAVEKMVGREGLLTLRSRLPYITRTTDDMLPTTVYTADGKTFDAEIAHPSTHLPIRPEITTVLDIVTRKVVGISLALSENQRSVAEALRNACVACGIPAIFYVDRGPGYKNEAMDADVSGLMGRLSITKMHALPYGSQAKGRIERPNATIWDTFAKRFPTYMGRDMDKEAGQKIHKITRRELKEFGQSAHLPSWDEFVRLAWEMVGEYNDAPHSSLPKCQDPKTGKRRTMSPNECWAMYVASGFEAVPVDPDEADDLFRPYEVRTVSRGIVRWNTNEFYHDALGAYHSRKVMVGYDWHQANRVWVREFDRDSGQPGRLICVAQYGGNHARYLPLSAEQSAVEARAKGRLRRVDAKRDAIEAERDAMQILDQRPAQSVDFFSQVSAPEAAPIARSDAVEIQSIAPALPRRRTFGSDEELAAWALENPTELTPNQIRVLRGCIANSTARKVLELSGIDTEALRTLLRAAA